MGIKVTKNTVAKGVSKVIPIIGGVISGTLNFASMIPMANRLLEVLDKASFDYSTKEMNKILSILKTLQMVKHQRKLSLNLMYQNSVIPLIKGLKVLVPV